MDHKEQHHLKHAKEREHKKQEQRQHESEAEKSSWPFHPHWLYVFGAVLVLVAMLVWILLV